MKREWKPGDVALRTFEGKTSLSMVSECGQHMSNGPHWHHSDGGWDLLAYVSAPVQSMATYHPLVVIDPEDREQVERLVDAYRYVSGEVELTDGPWSIPGLRMQAALREFAKPTPPKPEEPLGLGAVVEDAAGQRWVRAGLTHRKADDWRCVEGERVGYWSEWDSITAVRVLSEGVTEDGAS